MADVSPEEQLKQQKENCIFCRIVSGAVPSKKVFEDDKMVAILDIRPAAKGHILVLTKEHYPIMPLIPPDEFQHLFGTTAALSGAVKEAALAQRTTTFIANGAIAGQQSPHFLFHLIPREKGDPLSMLDVKGRKVEQAQVGPLIAQNLGPVMRQHLVKTGKERLLEPIEEQRPLAAAESVVPHSPPSFQAPKVSVEQLASIIEENPEIKALLMNNPAKLRTIIDENPEFRALFGDIDLAILGEQIRGRYVDTAPAAPAPPQPAPQQVKASQLTLEQLFSFIDRQPHLRDLILSEPKRLKFLVEEDPELRAFFEGVNIHEVITAYQEYAKTAASSSDAAFREDALKPANQMTLQELFSFIDAKPKLRDLMLYEPNKLLEMAKTNEKVKRFFAGSNLKAIIQAYQEHAKRHGVRVTVEPDEEPAVKGEVRAADGPSREEEASAWSEVRGMKVDLDKISKLFR